MDPAPPVDDPGDVAQPVCPGQGYRPSPTTSSPLSPGPPPVQPDQPQEDQAPRHRLAQRLAVPQVEQPVLDLELSPVRHHWQHGRQMS